MLGPTITTPYDLRFQLLGVPVTVTPFFWAVAALIGFDWLNVEPGGPANLIAVVLCVFVSILAHEFGHALTMRHYRHDPEVVLYHFGGFARPSHRDPPGRTFIIVAAGPAVSLALAGGAYALERSLEATGRMPEFGTPLFAALWAMVHYNFFWAILNLLPVWPLDGGQMLGAVLDMTRLEEPMEWTLKVGIGAGGFAAASFLLLGQTFAAILFVMLAVQNYQKLQSLRSGPWW